MSSENQWLEDVFPIENSPFFRGHVVSTLDIQKYLLRCFYVFRVQNNLSGVATFCSYYISCSVVVITTIFVWNRPGFFS